MNSKQFRVGNYINFGNILSEITGVMLEQIMFKYISGGRDQYASLLTGGINLIDVNEEYLLKFGFKIMPRTEYTLNTFEFEGFQIWNKKGDFTEIIYLSNRDSIEVKYVHQLQNLFFALKGNELYLKKNNHE